MAIIKHHWGNVDIESYGCYKIGDSLCSKLILLTGKLDMSLVEVETKQGQQYITINGKGKQALEALEASESFQE